MIKPQPKWRKSSHSTDNGGECVELAALPTGIGVRDSKNPDGGHISVAPSSMRALIAHIKQL